MKIKLGHVSTLPTYIRKTLKADDLKWALINTYSSLILEFITQNLFKCRPVWPDAEIKSGPIFSKFAQNVAKSVFISKGTFFKIAQKWLHIWATFETKYFTQNLENRPIWSHWSSVPILHESSLVEKSNKKVYETVPSQQRDQIWQNLSLWQFFWGLI